MPVAKTASLEVRALLPMACDGVGPSAHCLAILQGMAEASAACTVHINRRRIPIHGIAYRSAVPSPFGWLPYHLVKGAATHRSEAGFLAALSPGEIAYLWSGTPLRTYERVAGRGNPIVMEGINIRMVHAKVILDAEYDRLGLEPTHGITQAGIDEEERKLALASAIFAPSPGVEAALADSPLPPERVLATSYGVDVSAWRDPPKPRDRPLRVLFVGTACVRKGIHHLLAAWAAARIPGDLVIAGAVEPAIRRICADHLSRQDVTTLGFVRDVDALYREADVFVMPSLEEGGPLVTYEAAAHGLPLVVSPMGAGRLASDGESAGAIPIDPHDPETTVAALRRLQDPDLRRLLGHRARQTVEGYDWTAVGRRRARLLAGMGTG